jgi:hypothetical protein
MQLFAPADRRVRGSLSLLVIGAALCVGAPCVAQEEPLERAVAPPEAAPGTLVLSAPELAGTEIIQVNVGAGGMNIVGDAANEPSIAVDPTAPNRMVIGWRQFDTISNSFRQAGYAWTNDGGRTWNNDGPLTPGVFRSDPVLDADRDGVLYYYSLSGNNFLCDIFTSTDGGQTWSSPTPAFGGDKAWLDIDTSGAMTDGNLYVAWSTAANPFPPNQFTRSFDGGATFGGPFELPNPKPIWGTMDVDRDGTLYLGGRVGSTVRVLKSTNAGMSAMTPTFDIVSIVPLDGSIQLGGGPNPQGLLGQVWVTVDKSGGASDGNVYVLASVGNASDPNDVRFSRSTDGGLTYEPSARLNDDPPGAWQWFGTMSIAPNGRLDAVWYDTRDATAGMFESVLYFTSSEDAGVTWSPPEAMSPDFDPHVGWPSQNKLGDYIQLVSDDVGAHLAWAATFNGEQDVYYTRIGDYDCNGNGVGDSEDLMTGAAEDCNGNEIPDSCEIAAGAAPDLNGNGVPDECDCYPDCDQTTGAGVLDIFDFLCFQDAFVSGNPYADCDENMVLDVFDFLCFQDAFIAGCP